MPEFNSRIRKLSCDGSQLSLPWKMKFNCSRPVLFNWISNELCYLRLYYRFYTFDNNLIVDCLRIYNLLREFYFFLHTLQLYSGSDLLFTYACVWYVIPHAERIHFEIVRQLYLMVFMDTAMILVAGNQYLWSCVVKYRANSS